MLRQDKEWGERNVGLKIKMRVTPVKKKKKKPVLLSG